MNISEPEFNNIRHLVKRLCGIWLTDDKKYLVVSRLASVLKKNQIESYSALVQRASSANNIRLHEEIIEAITTHETSFNRDGHPFEEFRRTILPNLIATRAECQRVAGLPFGKIRIWSAAVSTGQEAYSLAMGILEHIQTQPRNAANGFVVTPENFSILGTDICASSLSTAKEGCYHERDLERGLGNDLKQKSFVERERKFWIHQAAKNLIDFRRLNLIHPFGDLVGMDMVLCRNVLIYFDDSTKRAVTEQLIMCLAPGGMLMLGAAESIPVLPPGIVQEQFGRTVVFRKSAAKQMATL